MPGKKELVAIGSTFGPATILYVAKTSAYLLIQATATSLSTLALAAHQPVFSIWGLVRTTLTDRRLVLQLWRHAHGLAKL